MQTASHGQPGMRGHPAPLGSSWHASEWWIFCGASRGSSREPQGSGSHFLDALLHIQNYIFFHSKPTFLFIVILLNRYSISTISPLKIPI